MAGKVYEYLINLRANIDNKLESSMKSMEKIQGRMSSSLESNLAKQDVLRAKMGSSTTVLTWNQTTTAIENTNQALNSLIGPGVKFNNSMAELKAITGASDKQLEQMGDSARNLAKEFGGSAAGQLESYKLILSRLGPEIAQTPEALDAMGRSVSILSKTMGGDTVAATEALTTAMNQYGVDLSDPMKASADMAKMMDVMAAGAQLGAAEIPQVSAALAVAGSQAKAANISFQETNAAIQVLGKGSKYGSEAGTALRNVIGKLGEGRFLPKEVQEEFARAGVSIDRLSDNSLSLYERMSELQKIQGDSALMTKFFGTENAAAGSIMLSNLDLLKNYTEGVDKQGAALEQAQSFMEGYSEKQSRLNALFADFGISIFNGVQAFTPYLSMAADGALILANLGAAQSALAVLTKALTFENIKNSISMTGLKIQQGFLTVTSWAATAGTWALTIAQRALNAAFLASPWGWVALAIGAVVAAIIIAYNKFDGFKKLVDGIIEKVAIAFDKVGKLLGFTNEKNEIKVTAEKTEKKQTEFFGGGMPGEIKKPVQKFPFINQNEQNPLSKPQATAQSLMPDINSIAGLKQAIKDLTASRDKMTDKAQIIKANTQLEDYQRRLKTMQGDGRQNAKDGVDAITAGGKQSINIRLDNVKFAETFTITVEKMDEALENVEDKFKDFFARVLNGSLATVNQ